MNVAEENKYYSKELILKAQNNDKNAMNLLLEKNAPLINSLVKKYLQFSFEYDDLFQVGSIGLIKAVRKFDFNYNTQFSTYAVYVINGELKRYVRDDGIIKVSRNLKNIYIMAKAEIERCVKKNGREPGISEIAEKINVSREDVANAFDACRSPEYLQEKIYGDNSEKTALDDIADEKNDITELMDRIFLKEAISSLDKESREIMLLRYFKNMTQTETAKILGMSQVQISRKEKKIIENIKKRYCE